MEYIIVLGNRNKNIMKKRVDRAIQEFNSTPIKYFNEFTGTIDIIKYLIFSGGSSDGVSKPESAIMMDKYAKQFVDKQHVIMEDKSRNTIENLVNSKKIIKSISQSYIKPKIVICTSTFHIKRTIILSKLIFEGYTMNFIHTNETISKEEDERENLNLISNVNSYCNNIISSYI